MHIDVKHKRFSSIDANEMRNNKMHTVASHALRRVHLFNELSPEALNVDFYIYLSSNVNNLAL